MVKKIIFFLSLTFKVSFCRSPGPPTDNSVCNDLKPSKSSPHRLQVGNGTYSLSVDAYRSSFSPYFMYTSGQNYSSKLNLWVIISNLFLMVQKRMNVLPHHIYIYLRVI